ncbi:MAG: L,D-transpeptidase family protein [Hyphomicrobiaceae bacterium]|nr:L,D-transpeptidase family protein [Hyphomicrobiaceae bacterium]
MSLGRLNATTIAILCALLQGGTALPALAQSSSSHAAVDLDNDRGPVPESGAPDPLTPPPSNAGAPAAPGGTVPLDEATAPAEADPVVVLVREKLAAFSTKQSSVDKDDLAAAATYYGEHKSPVWTGKDGLTERGTQAAAEIARAEDWGLEAKAFDLPVALSAPVTPDMLAEAEVKLALAVLTYARHARGGRLEPATVSRKFDQKPVVFEPKTVLQGIGAAAAADAYLRDLHPKHPQFEKLRQALLTLRKEAGGAAGEAAPGSKAKPAAVTERQLVVNMERWRWMPPELGAFYVWNSITEQITRVVDNGKVVLSERIVVGKTSSPTPIFSADMQFVIFHPSWGVPSGIKSHELGPKLRNSGSNWFSFKPPASSVLRAHGLIASRGGRPVDPDSVDWEKVDIRSFDFTQPAGQRNVLGIVKFRFPNKHDVYMHDTQERHLFGGAVRAFSHGCMRVQNPMHLAEVLLAHDKGWTKEQVKASERRGEQVTLSTPIPVHINYFTVEVVDDGKLVTRSDIYGLDSRVASALEGHTVSVASAPAPRSEASADDGQPVRPASSSRRKHRSRSSTASSEPYSPFASLFGD